MTTITELLQQEPATVAEKILDIHPEQTPWLDEFAEVLDRTRAGRALGRILEVWGLNQSDAAKLFGVSRQAVSKWLARGVPSERVEAVADLAAATDLLVRYVKRDRIPAVVRRPAAALGNHSLIHLAANSRTKEVLAACRAMFAFSRAMT